MQLRYIKKVNIWALISFSSTHIAIGFRIHFRILNRISHSPYILAMNHPVKGERIENILKVAHPSIVHLEIPSANCNHCEIGYQYCRCFDKNSHVTLNTNESLEKFFETMGKISFVEWTLFAVMDRRYIDDSYAFEAFEYVYRPTISSIPDNDELDQAEILSYKFGQHVFDCEQFMDDFAAIIEQFHVEQFNKKKW